MGKKKSAAFFEITHVYLKNTITTKKLEIPSKN